MIRRLGDLDTSEDPAHERREQVAQRIAWVVMALFVAAGVAGLLGSGPLARTSTVLTDGTRVGYARFARALAPSPIELTVPPGRPLIVWLGSEAAAMFEVDSIVPAPTSTRVEDDRAVYDFGAGPGKVVFNVRHQSAGWKSLRIGSGEGPPVTLKQLVYP